MDEMIELERQLAKLQAKADLHGNTPGIEAEMQAICGKLDEIEMGAGEDWLRKRDQELGRALRQTTKDTDKSPH